MMNLLKFFKKKINPQTEELKKRYKYKMEIKSNIKIEINKDLNEKLNWFTHNYDKEISGWLIGEITKERIYIEDIIFPHQDVSSASVDTDGKSLIKLRKEYGDKCLRIIGHWHSHVRMGTFWSGDDEEFMSRYGNPRAKTVFIVSSDGDPHKVRLKLMEPFDISIDDLEYSIEDKNNELANELNKVIEEKVIESKPIERDYQSGFNPNWGNGEFSINGRRNFNEEDILTDERIEEMIIVHKNNVIIKELTQNQYEELESVYANIKHQEWNGKTGKMIYECTSQNQAETFEEELKDYLRETFVDLEVVENEDEPLDDDYWANQEEKYKQNWQDQKRFTEEY